LAALDFNHRILLRNVANGKELPPLAEFLPADARPRIIRKVLAYDLSPDGRTLLTVTVPGNKEEDEHPKATLRLWDVATGRPIRQMVSEEGAGGVAFSADGRNLALVTAKHVVVWETASGKERYRFPATAGVPAFSPDGRLLVVAERDAVRVWDVRAGKELARLTGHTGPVLGMTFTSDGRALLTASADSTALIWDANRLRARLAPSADLTAKQVESLWDDLAAADADKAFKAIAGLSGDPKRSAAWLKDHIKPAAAPDPKAIEQWLTELNSDTFETRERAARELEKAGELVIPALNKELKGNPPPEARRRVEELLERLRSSQVPPATVLRELRAVEVLEQAGTPDARRLLEDLAGGVAEAPLTREAKAALARLSPN
jgi:Tol biopolymer transport system component